MKIECNDQKTFKLSEEDNILGQIVYKSIFSDKADITLADSGNYTIKPAGVFTDKIAVLDNGAEIACLKMNWKGHIIIDFASGEKFIFKTKGTFHCKYVIENKEGETLIQYEPHFNWSKFNYNYDVLYNERPSNLLLVLLGAYVANYKIVIMSGAVIAVV